MQLKMHEHTRVHTQNWSKQEPQGQISFKSTHCSKHVNSITKMSSFSIRYIGSASIQGQVIYAPEINKC